MRASVFIELGGPLSFGAGLVPTVPRSFIVHDTEMILTLRAMAARVASAALQAEMVRPWLWDTPQCNLMTKSSTQGLIRKIILAMMVPWPPLEQCHGFSVCRSDGWKLRPVTLTISLYMSTLPRFTPSSIRATCGQIEMARK